MFLRFGLRRRVLSSIPVLPVQGDGLERVNQSNSCTKKLVHKALEVPDFNNIQEVMISLASAERSISVGRFD